MHKYFIGLRIYSETLDPRQVTNDLGLSPSQIVQIGERKHWKHAMWEYNASETDVPIAWDSLENGLSFLLERLMPLKEKIDVYKETNSVILWCGHFQSSFDGGPTLSPELLKQLGEFEVELFIDNYFSEERSDTPE